MLLKIDNLFKSNDILKVFSNIPGNYTKLEYNYKYIDNYNRKLLISILVVKS